LAGDFPKLTAAESSLIDGHPASRDFACPRLGISAVQYRPRAGARSPVARAEIGSPMGVIKVQAHTSPRGVPKHSTTTRGALALNRADSTATLSHPYGWNGALLVREIHRLRRVEFRQRLRVEHAVAPAPRSGRLALGSRKIFTQRGDLLVSW